MASESWDKSSAEEGEDEEEEAVEEEAGGKRALASGRAHRPMNAFLLFCKRHRAVVRSRCPRLENRAITKILGEWWAHLEELDKACYVQLASQYREAFLRANPGFHWADRGHAATPPAPAVAASPSVAIVPGKLADESQLGTLSSLLQPREAAGAKQPPKKRFRQATAAAAAATAAATAKASPASSDCTNFTAVITTSQIINRVVEKLCGSLTPADLTRSKRKSCESESSSGTEEARLNGASDRVSGKKAKTGKGSPGKRKLRPTDFNLEEKISRLPSLSLEEFWEKKKRARKRNQLGKRAGAAWRASGGSHGSGGAGTGGAGPGSAVGTPQQGPQLVGSQKRKARKARIQRRRDSLMDSQPDGLGLATLAEVAAAECHLATTL